MAPHKYGPSVWFDFEQTHGKHTPAAGIAIIEHLLDTCHTFDNGQIADVKYLLDTFKHLKSSQNGDDCAQGNVRTTQLAKNTDKVLLNISQKKSRDSAVLQRVKGAVSEVRTHTKVSERLRPKFAENGAQRTQLDMLHSWSEFSIFDFAKVCPCPLKCVAFEALSTRCIFQSFGCDTRKALAFFAKVEDMYMKENNAYHNNLHAADVTQGVHSILCHKSMEEAFAEIEVFSLLLAAVGHDVAHPGFTNNFLVNSRHDLALTYNDKSVNENMHCAEFWRLLHRIEYCFLESLSQPKQDAIRKYVIHSILGTDMAHHSSNDKIFNDMINSQGADIQKWDDMEQLQVATLHAADISSPTRKLDVALEWTDRVYTEFFHQGDLEREAGLPISALCDRNNISIADGQLGFVKFIVAPTFAAMFKIDPAMSEQLGNIAVFNDHWEEVRKYDQ